MSSLSSEMGHFNLLQPSPTTSSNGRVLVAIFNFIQKLHIWQITTMRIDGPIGISVGSRANFEKTIHWDLVYESIYSVRHVREVNYRLYLRFRIFDVEQISSS